MKNLLSFSFILLTIFAFGQKPDSIMYQGQYHYIYPYKQPTFANSRLIASARNSKKEKRALELYTSSGKPIFYAKSILKNADYFFSTTYQFDTDPIPSLDPMPDGKYVQVFLGYFKIDKKNKIVIDTTKVAGVFTLKNNMLEGNGYWFNTVGDTLKKGKYLKGSKEGTWVIKKEENKYIDSKKEVLRFCKKTLFSTIETNEFHAGAKNGIYIKELYGNVLTKGHFKDGNPDGEWFRYELNSTQEVVLMEHFTYADQKTISHKPYIRDDFRTPNWHLNRNKVFPRVPEISIDFSTFWICPRPKTNLNQIEERYTYNRGYTMRENIYERSFSYNNEYILRSKLIDSIGIINKFTNLYEAYYSNGKPKYKLYFKNGDLITEDTIFWSNGKLCDVILFHPEKNEFENKKFDIEGKIVSIDIYDQKGAFLRKDLDPDYAKNHLTIDNLYPCSIIDNSHFKYFDKTAIYNHKNNENSIYYKRWFLDTTVNIEKYYNPKTKTFTEINYSILGNKKSENTYQFSEKFESFLGNSTTYLGDLSIKTITDGTIRGAAINQLDSLNYIKLTERNQNFKKTEQSTVLFQNQPFSGKVEIDYRKNKIDYRLSKNKIKFFIGSGYKSTRKINRSAWKYVESKEIKNQKILQYFENSTSELNFDDVFFPQFIKVSNFYSPVIEGQVDRSRKVNRAVRKIEGSMHNGLPSGVWTVIGKRGKIISTFTFVAGNLNGPAKKYSIQAKKPKSTRNNNGLNKYTEFPKKATYFLEETAEYKDGLLQGKYVKYNWQGKTIANANFENDEIIGVSVGRTAITSTYINHKNNQIDGSFKTYLRFPGKDSLLLYDLNSIDGKFDGECKSYHLNGKLARIGVFKNGVPIDNYKSYDSLGNLFHEVHFQLGKPVEEIIYDGKQIATKFLFNLADSVYFSPFNYFEASASFSEFGDNQNDLFNDYQIFNQVKSQHSKLLDGNRVDKEHNEYYLVKYFPNENIAREGAFNDSKKNGLWKFYNYEGQKLYEINYFDSLITLNDSIEFKSFGEKYEYDLTGKLLSKSYVIEKNEKYDCSNSDHYEIRQFFTTWQANDTLKRINGYVKNYYDNGVIQSEGQMQNGLPTGVWKIYDPNGKLNMLGEYVYGKKQGRWLKGDLSKIKYLGEICLNPNLPDLEAQINYREKLLDIEIYYYKLGQRLNSEKYNLNLNKKDQFGNERNYNRYEEEYELEINSDIQLR
jgi:antitoxin component YwqK of YwqJK toxin-antitoxin module